MKVVNCLPLLLDSLKKWDRPPSAARFLEEFAKPMEPFVGDFFEDFHEVLVGLNWGLYRKEALRLDPAKEEARLTGHIEAVEGLFGLKLEGEAILLGAFTAMDGYARFDRGAHRVFLGVDESHGRGRYLDVLMVHELAHVARESRPEVWTCLGLSPTMSNDEFTSKMPVIEHLMSEGFSCVVSEILVPEEASHGYCYQDADTLAYVLEHGPALDRVIHRALRSRRAHYGSLYNGNGYLPRLPDFAHYVWAWQWVKHLLVEVAGGDARKLLDRCAADFVEDALRFELKELLGGKVRSS